MTLRVPGYQVGELIGRGSQAVVFAGTVARSGPIARSGQRLRSSRMARLGAILEPGQPVALKQFNPITGVPSVLREADLLRAARAEAALLAVFDHPNLIKLYDFVVTESDLILVTEGGSLAQLQRRRTRLSPAEVAAALSPVAAALAHVHEQGVRHGDVSAGNILFTADGDPKLADLGVARLIGQGSSALGTPAYLDPRVARGAEADAGSDVFALAAVGLHALTGAGPWHAAGPCSARGARTIMGELTRDAREPGLGADAMIALARRGDLSDLAERLRGVPAAVSAPLLRALDVQGAARGTAAEFALDLAAAALGGSVTLTAGRIHPSGAPNSRASGAEPHEIGAAGNDRSDGQWTRLSVRAATPTAGASTSASATRPGQTRAASTRAASTRAASTSTAARSAATRSAAARSTTARSAMANPSAASSADVVNRSARPVAQPRTATNVRPFARSARGRHAADAHANSTVGTGVKVVGGVLRSLLGRQRAGGRRKLAAVAAVLLAAAAIVTVTLARNAGPAEAARGAAGRAMATASMTGAAGHSSPAMAPGRPATTPSGAPTTPTKSRSSDVGSGLGRAAAGGVEAGSRSAPPGARASAAVAIGALKHLDALRTDAFGRRDPHVLSAVYDSRLLLDQDVAQLERLVPVGCGLIGLRTRFSSLAVSASTTSRIELQVDEAVSPARRACPLRTLTPASDAAGLAAASQNSAAGGGARRVALVLLRSAAGWRISAQRVIDPAATG